jgi:uncharacterized repeat protein (TIGR03803 family)
MTNTQGNRGWAAAMLAAMLLLAAATAALAQNGATFTTLLSFSGTSGYFPYAPLAQGTDGNLYGTTGGYITTSTGGSTVFKITPDGSLTTLTTPDNFQYEQPYGGLVPAPSGDFYGTTSGIVDGAGTGTAFKVSASGVVTTLANLNTNPYAGLVQAPLGDLYGTASYGGSGAGSIFKVTPEGTVTTLHEFSGSDGSLPYAGLIQDAIGNFYGATAYGGTDGYGTVFKLSVRGLTTLHSFSSTDGANPDGTLVQGRDGNYYGTTWVGGTNNDGTIFKITSSGALTTLYNFSGIDGANSYGALIQANDGNFYGTTVAGGTGTGITCTGGCGTIFKITAAGALTTLHNFDSSDGAAPYAGLLQATTGIFYGTTVYGGSYCGGGCGTIFTLSVGLGPFAKTVSPSGRVGSIVRILGNNLTGATSVTFNGTTASFSVYSSTVIAATIPTGASTGPVQVVTPSGTLNSNVNFRVLP